MNVIKVIILILCNFYFFAGRGQTVEASIDKSRISIGDQFSFKLQLHSNSNNFQPKIHLSTIEESDFIHILDQSPLFKSPSDPGIEFNQNFILSIYDTGYFEIPPVLISGTNDGKNFQLRTNSIPIEVLAPQIDTAVLAPIKPIIKEPWKIEDAIYIIYIQLILLFIALMIWAIVRKKEIKEFIFLPNLSPYQEAEIALSGLKDKQLWQKGEVKAYQSELSLIIRHYLSDGFDIPAIESSTSEIIKDLHKTQFDQPSIQILKELFSTADLVKFAKAQPSAETNIKLFESAESFLLSSKDQWKLKEEERKKDLELIKSNAEKQGYLIVDHDRKVFRKGQKIKLAPFQYRFIAECLDVLIFVLLYFIIKSGIKYLFDALSFHLSSHQVTLFCIAIIFLLYNGLEVYLGARPAKFLMGMRTFNLSLEKLSWSKEIQKNFQKIILLFNIPYMIKSIKHKIPISRHDLKTNTRVILK